MRILLVEDSRFLRSAMERTLAKQGYVVVAASDGEEALVFAREIPDLILLDLMLPKMSGPDVLRALKADPVTAGIPVVVLSGLSKKNEAKLMGDGAAAYFEKSEQSLKNGMGGLVELIGRVTAQTAL